MLKLAPLTQSLPTREAGPCQSLCKDESSFLIRHILDSSDPTSRLLIEGRFGLGRSAKSLHALANEVGCSDSHARRLFDSAMDKIERELRRHGIDSCE